MTCRYGILFAKRGCFKATGVICDFCCMMPLWRKIETDHSRISVCDAMLMMRKSTQQEETRAEREREREPKTNTDGRHNDYAHPPVTLPRSERRLSSSICGVGNPETYRGNKLGRKSFSFRVAQKFRRGIRPCLSTNPSLTAIKKRHHPIWSWVDCAFFVCPREVCS